MISDSINEEIRAFRRQLAAQCDNDLARIFAEARERQSVQEHFIDLCALVGHETPMQQGSY